MARVGFRALARPPLEVIIARIFNLIGPGMSIDQAFGRIAACLALSRDIPVRLTAGDLDARRDFVDVRDAAIALIALALQGQTGRVYHVGTGRSRSIREGINGLVRRAGRPVILASDPVARYGPRDSRTDNRRIIADTDWRPRFSFEQSLDDLWNDANAEILGGARNR